MLLTPKQRQHLKARAHKLKPVVIIGNKGLTDNVKNEIDRALTDHELIKIRIHAEDRDQREEILNEIIATTHAAKVQLIGGMGTIYRQKKD